MKVLRKGKNPLVCIVIVNWNGEKVIFDCLNSIKKTEYNNCKVVVVDNGSSDKSIQIIKKFDKAYLKLKKPLSGAPSFTPN